MDSPVNIARGRRVLCRLLGERLCDLRGLDLAGFRHWLEVQLARWQRDPLFVHQARLRDLRRAHPDLVALEEQCRSIQEGLDSSEQEARFRWLEKELRDTSKAISGLTAALEQAGPEKRPILEHKLAGFRTQYPTLLQEYTDAYQSSPERQALFQATAQMNQLRSATGLDREEADLQTLMRQQGHRSGHAGESFEQLALTVTQSHLVPRLLGRRPGASAEPRRCVLQGVKLGVARMELDQVVIQEPNGQGQAVDVLAVVEAKRNLNDLAHGFRLRQENLAWLTAHTNLYDVQAYRTNYFRSGHFDREAWHEQRGERFLFTRRSFRRFRKESGTDHFLRRLYFITQMGSLWGVSATALARIRHRIATDVRWNLTDEAYLGQLLAWCQSLAAPVEAPDILRLYASAPRWGRRILVVGRK